jgi:hypothetical protein
VCVCVNKRSDFLPEALTTIAHEGGNPTSTTKWHLKHAIVVRFKLGVTGEYCDGRKSRHEGRVGARACSKHWRMADVCACFTMYL